jgi:hypothetical protein
VTLSEDSPHEPLPDSISTHIKPFRGWLLFRYKVNTIEYAGTNAIGSRTSFVIAPVRSSINGDPDIDGRIILRWIFRKWEGVAGTGWSGLRIGTGGGHL